jgi:hypothetical protein
VMAGDIAGADHGDPQFAGLQCTHVFSRENQDS